jgi:hypothetical protein
LFSTAFLFLKLLNNIIITFVKSSKNSKIDIIEIPQNKPNSPLKVKSKNIISNYIIKITYPILPKSFSNDIAGTSLILVILVSS